MCSLELMVFCPFYSQFMQFDLGGFHLVALIVRELKSHMIDLLKFKSPHWLKLQHSDWRANLVKDFFFQIDFPPIRALEFITDHVTYD